MPKNATTLRREAHRVLDELEGPRLRVARDFLDYLRLRQADDLTLEVLSDSKMLQDIRIASEDLRASRTSKFVRFEKVRRNV